MLRNFNNIILAKLFLLILTCGAASCHSNKEKITSLYNNYKFDQKVIEKLPVYDSLALSILEKFTLFKQNIDENEAYQAYRYKPASVEMDVFNKLPPGVGSNIDYYFARIGKDFISGFDVFKDSSIKIYIRSQPAENSSILIEQNLSYYPIENRMRLREFPSKDTALTAHWQYWIRFNDEDLF